MKRTLNELDKWTYNHADVGVFEELYEEFGTTFVIEDGMVVATEYEDY